jgi:hypothetical protein
MEEEKPKKKKKLTLNRETLRDLSESELREIHGASGGSLCEPPPPPRIEPPPQTSFPL